MVHFSKFLKLVAALLLISAVRADYFKGLDLDKELISQANQAMAALSNSLRSYLDCSKSNPAHSENNQSKRACSNSAGNIFSHRRYQIAKPAHYHGRFRKNRDQDIFSFFLPKLREILSLPQQQALSKDLHAKAMAVAVVLQKIKDKLSYLNNIVIGNNNKINGQNNVVIGNQNNLDGNDFWIFDSDVHTKGIQDGVLIVDNYLIEIDDIEQILVHPDKAIRCLDKAEKQKKATYWHSKASNCFNFHF